MNTYQKQKAQSKSSGLDFTNSDTFRRKLELHEAIIEYSHRYFLSREFKPILSPKIVPFTDDEQAHLISVNVPGKKDEKLFLSRTPQFYKEIAALKSEGGKVYEIGSVFRGEPISYGRRATEFVGLDVELKTNELKEVTDILTDFVLGLSRDKKLIEAAGKFSPQVNFPDGVITITYKEGTEMVSSKEIDGDAERRLSELVRSDHKNSWILLTEFPFSNKRFSYQTKDGNLTKSFDLIGEWEIASGGLRRRDIHQYMELLRDMGWSTREFEPYAQVISKNPEQNTGGFGMGLERLLGAITGITSIEEIQPYPRTPDSKVLF